MPQYHSEPITRSIVGNWHKSMAKQYATQTGDPDAEREWVEKWEQWASDDAPKEQLVGYFSTITSTFTIIGFMISLLTFGTLTLLNFMEIDVFNLWSVVPFVFVFVAFSLSFGSWLESWKTRKVESYMGYFDGGKFALFLVLGVLAFALMVLGLSYLGDTPFWVNN